MLASRVVQQSYILGHALFTRRLLMVAAFDLLWLLKGSYSGTEVSNDLGTAGNHRLHIAVVVLCR